MITTTFKKMVRRIPLLILIIVGLIVLRRSETEGIVFPQEPAGAAQWKIPSPDHNHIGGVITAILYITTQKGVSLDLSLLPNVGGVMQLPARVDPSQLNYNGTGSPKMISEGELEVVSRTVREHVDNGLVITEIAYGFLYLQPIDLSAPRDDKQLPTDLRISQGYLLATSNGNATWQTSKISIEAAEFSIEPRVDSHSQPIFTLFEPTPPPTSWPYVRYVGYGLIGLAMCFVLWRGVSLLSARRRYQTIVDTPQDATELYAQWSKDPDYNIFIETLKLYRKGIWGRPQASTWIVTTFILYSGATLGHDQIETIFAQIVKEVAREDSS